MSILSKIVCRINQSQGASEVEITRAEALELAESLYRTQVTMTDSERKLARELNPDSTIDAWMKTRSKDEAIQEMMDKMTTKGFEMFGRRIVIDG